MVIKRALLSVSDKTGLLDFAKILAELKIEILSTGGTAKALKDAGLAVTDVAAFTGAEEMLDGRVKTLHPKVHAGILYRRELDDHAAQMEARGYSSIDLVVVNLYPFKATIEKPGVTFEEAIENIDIGGPCLLRASAKNHAHVTVICDPADYQKVGLEIKENGATSPETRRLLAQKAFSLTSSYDALISQYLS